MLMHKISVLTTEAYFTLRIEEVEFGDLKERDKKSSFRKVKSKLTYYTYSNKSSVRYFISIFFLTGGGRILENMLIKYLNAPIVCF